MQDRLISGRLVKSGKSLLLLGARQVGKSTLCRSLLMPELTIDLADEGEFLRYAKDPELLKRELAARPSRSAKPPKLVFIDEVQRIPSLLNTVQAIIDGSRGSPGGAVRFLLTGSSARKLRGGGANLLPGRIVLEHLDPLSILETPKDFDLDAALQAGMLPGIYLAFREGDREALDVLGTYAEVYLREEIREEALVKNVGSYARFLDVAATLSGQWLNYSKISSDVEIPKETIRRYIEILEETLLMFRIPSFVPDKKITRRISHRDKLFFFDVGVRNALLGTHLRPVTLDQRGPVFEQWLVLQIIYLGRALKKNWRLSSYRAEGGGEVDLVIESGDRVIGLEIKASRNVGPQDRRGLHSLAEVVGRPRGRPMDKWIAYLGPKRQRFDDGVEAIPYLEILSALAD